MNRADPKPPNKSSRQHKGPAVTGGAPATTHAAYGAGHPRLVLVVSEEDWDGQPQPEFELLGEKTTIGAADGADLRLKGIEPNHAEIIHDEFDEYVLFVHGTATLGSDLVSPLESDGPRPGRVLRTGAQFALGPWQFTYSRDEFADHGRPGGGREGGEADHQPSQPPRPDYQDQGRPSPVPEQP